MKKENDEITDLFRTRLADAGMSVRDGFWEELSQEIPVACQHRRRILLFLISRIGMKHSKSPNRIRCSYLKKNEYLSGNSF